jgi:predicted Zn-dependent protease
LLIALWGLGCGSTDPLEDIRGQHRAGLYEDSLEPLRELLKTKPEEPEVHYLYGIALLQAGGPSLAQFPLQRAMKDSEWLVPAGITLASGAIATHNPDTAILVLEEVLEAEPDNVRALVMRANAHILTRRHYAEALVDADRVLELDPDNLPVLAFRAVALLGLVRVGEAGAALEEMERRYKDEGLEVGDTSRYCATRALFALEKGDTNAADRIFGQCLEQFPASSPLVDAALQFYEGQRRPARVLEMLRTALEESGGKRAFRVPLVMRLQAAGKSDEAKQLLQTATESPQPVLAAAAGVDLAGYLLDLKQHDEGIEAFQSALAVLPEPTPQLLFQYADALLVSNRYEEALEAARQNTVPAYRALIEGRVFLAQGEPATALEHFSEGLRTWPNHAVGRYYAGLAAEASGQIDRAIEEYRYSIRASSGGTDARIRLARLHLAEGKPEQALTALQHNVASSPNDLAGVLIELETLARLGMAQHLPNRLLSAIQPAAVWGHAVAALASGARRRGGPQASLATIVGADRLDLSAPASAPALESLVQDLVAVARIEDAVARAQESLEAQPNLAAFHVIYGFALAASGTDPSRVRAAYDRALELEPENARALAGIARMAASNGDAQTALGLFERASAASPDEPEYDRALAEQLVLLGRSDEAETRLADLLSRHATDAQAASQLAALLEARAAERQAIDSLQRRAARFSGGEPRAALDAKPAPGS